MLSVELGRTGRLISRIGLGAMPLSLSGRPERADAKLVIRRALDLGVTLIDTADVYCIDENDINHNERLIAEALEELDAPDDVVVATKGGMTRPGGSWSHDARPDKLREAAARSLAALGVERIALYQLHAPDPRVPFESSVEALARLKEDGLIEAVGLSNVSLEKLRAAQTIVEIASVQNRFNPWDLRSEESGIVGYCDENAITFLPYSPVGGGRRVRTLERHEPLIAIGQRSGYTPTELVLAWILARSETLVPIPGASRVASIESSVRAADIELTEELADEIEATFASLSD